MIPTVLVLDTLSIYQYSVVPVSQIADVALRTHMQNDLRAFGLTEQTVQFDVSFPAGVGLPFYPNEYQAFALDTAQIQPEDYAATSLRWTCTETLWVTSCLPPMTPSRTLASQFTGSPIQDRRLRAWVN